MRCGAGKASDLAGRIPRDGAKHQTATKTHMLVSGAVLLETGADLLVLGAPLLEPGAVRLDLDAAIFANRDAADSVALQKRAPSRSSCWS